MSPEPVKAPAANEPAKRGEQTALTGKVTSAKMEKTIVVEVQRLVQHPKYRRVVRISKKFYAHDEEESAKVGDFVRIIECRPLSRLKRWALGSVIRRAVQVAVDHPALANAADTRVKKTLKKKSKKK